MRANFRTYLGLFLFTLATLMFEIALTRIFSVTIWYHFAFLAISLTMLGMTTGAIIVYLQPEKFALDKTPLLMSFNSLSFGFASIAAILAHIWSPILVAGQDPSTIVLVSLSVAIPLLLVAFAFSGIVVSLALTRFPEQLHRLYAVDLIGAAIGCNSIVLALQFMDGISAVFLIAAIACLSAYFFAPEDQKKQKLVSIACAVWLLTLSVANAYLFVQKKPLITMTWTKGMPEAPVLYQKWNSFSRIRVLGNPEEKGEPFGYFSPNQPKALVNQLYLDIDGCAETTLPRFDGNLKSIDYLRFDPIYTAYYLRPDSNVLVIGAGGGRDVMSALAMNQKSVSSVEVNANIANAVNNMFGDFTGHLDKNPRVTAIVDEARSHVMHSEKKYDIILASVVDTWAASASGAFSMTENSLYTVEAWETLLNHLSNTGILTVGRFYDRKEPAEFYRLTSLASEALRRTGVKDPRNHLCIVRLLGTGNHPDSSGGVGSILVSKQPFSKEMLAKLRDVCRELSFEIALTPAETLDPILAKLAAGEDLNSVYKLVPWDVSPPTDDRPFFFQTFSWSHILDPRSFAVGRNRMNALTGPLLLVTAMLVLFISLYCFRVPYLRTKDKESLKGSSPLFTYFFSIGLGFMFAEISQIQRFTIFLGHPTYGTTVVLFALLISTGIGSLLLKTIWRGKQQTLLLLCAVIGVLIAFGLVSPAIMQQCAYLQLVARIATAVVLLFPLGFVLGLMFPLGMSFAEERYPALTPWMWGINGAASVCGSVLAVLVAMSAGITASYWTGVLCYVGALYSTYLLDPKKPV
jgi:predicted membrane-bound spermidine synthase